MQKEYAMRRVLIAGILMTFILTACGDDNGTGSDGVTIFDLSGTWDVTTWEFTLVSDSSQKIDWVTLIGLEGTLTIDDDGNFIVTPMLPGGFASDQGRLAVEGELLYWDGEDDEEWVPFELNGTLTVHWPEPEFVDMDQDGKPEDAWLRVVFQRH
jgi:hypothetical protein